jgi:Zn ribbon nucleic-acid-binding protein
MVFPVPREKDFKFKRNPSASRFRNKINQERQKTKDRYLDDCFSKCPKCKMQDLIEVAIREKNVLRYVCLNLKCGFKKEKELIE